MPELSTIQALAGPDDEPHDAHAVPSSGGALCPNCGTRLQGRYCSGCGQLDQPLRQPVHRYLAQSLSEFFGLDGRVWRTLGILLFKPGKLTEAYLRGQRRRYLRPLRVYLSSTLLFFFLLSLLDPVGRFQERVLDRPALLDSTMTAGAYLAQLDARIAEETAEDDRQRAVADSLRAATEALATPAAGASVQAGRGERLEASEARFERAIERLAEQSNSRDDRMRAWQREQLAAFPADSLIRPGDLVTAAELVTSGGGSMDIDFGEGERWVGGGRAYQRWKAARTSDERAEAAVDLARSSIEKIPLVLFLMLPAFALLLKVIYVRRDWYYSEHLVFGLHTHAFAFLVFSVVAVLGAAGVTAGPLGVAMIVSAVAIPLYFLLAQKRVYGQGWMKTLAKAVVLGSVYGVLLLALGLTLTILLGMSS